MYELYLNTDLVDQSLESLNTSKTHLETTKSKIDAGYTTLSSCKGIEFVDLSSLKNDIQFLQENLNGINDIIKEIKRSEEEIILYSEDPTNDIFEKSLRNGTSSGEQLYKYDISSLPKNIQQNMKIERFHGEDIFVPKNYMMSLETYENFLEKEGLSQHKYLKNGCKSFAGIQAMGLFSKEALIRMDNKNLTSISPDYYYCVSITSPSKSAIEKEAILELTNGRPPILQVTQKTEGSRHWVALVGLKADAVFEACESGALDTSKITTKDQIVIDNAFDEKPIGPMDQFERDYYGRWNREKEAEDQFRIQIVNMDRLNRTSYARELKRKLAGEDVNLERTFFANR